MKSDKNNSIYIEMNHFFYDEIEETAAWKASKLNPIAICNLITQPISTKREKPIQWRRYWTQRVYRFQFNRKNFKQKPVVSLLHDETIRLHEKKNRESRLCDVISIPFFVTLGWRRTKMIKKTVNKCIPCLEQRFSFSTITQIKKTNFVIKSSLATLFKN